MLQVLSQFFGDIQILAVLTNLFYYSFFFFPIVFIASIAELFVIHKRAQFFAKTEYVLLEIKLPREMFKSPLAMELFLNSLYQTGGEGTWIDRWWKGKTRPWFSLEIVSVDGKVHFYMWSRKAFKNLIETGLYSQFPGVEVHESQDYTLPVSYNKETVGLWGSEFDLTQSDAYPIKTYIDYGMNEDPKEEYKIDPMTPLIEFMGSLGRGYNVFVQIIIRAHKPEDRDPEDSKDWLKFLHLKAGKKVDLKWKKAAESEIKKILEKAKGEKDEDGKVKPGRPLTKGETETIAAIERSVAKIAFDVGIRAILCAPKDIFSSDNVAGITGGFRNYNSNNLNGFKPARSPGGKYDYPWQDMRGKKTNREKAEMLDAYKHRGYFYDQFKRPYFVLNTEELATIFHFPGAVSTTPTFERIESRKAEAPANLPI